MKTKNNIIKLMFALFVAISYQSCETTELDLNNDPNALSPNQANPSFVLNGITFSFGQQQLAFSGISNGLMRQVSMRDSYANNAVTGTMNGVWNFAYQITNNVNFLKDQNSDGNLSHHVGVGLVIESMSYQTLVDYIGTAVFSQAVDFDQFPNPDLDSGLSIYDSLYTKLDEALTLLNTSNSTPFDDLFYGGDVSKWIKLANTLKIRMYIQSKLVLTADQIADLNNIISTGNYINTVDDDFVIGFSKNNNNPDARHPFFSANYLFGASVYMSNDYMNRLLNTKSIVDPRTPYYFYRQSLNNPPPADIDHCTSMFQYCYIGGGYIGRDHGDDEGIPNDNNQRTVYGIYPAGGAYDAAGTQTEERANAIASFVFDPTNTDLTEAEQRDLHIFNFLANVNGTVNENSGLAGAGIYPILTSSFVKFLLAEASLPSPVGTNSPGSSATYLEEAIRESFTKVSTLANIPMDVNNVNTYVNEVIMNFNTATSSEAKLAIIIEELYIAAFGNSVETYNAYRRTGFPANLSTHVLPGAGEFPRSFFIPSSEINSNDNPNLVQKTITDQVFWDTNPAGFIN